MAPGIEHFIRKPRPPAEKEGMKCTQFALLLLGMTAQATDALEPPPDALFWPSRLSVQMYAYRGKVADFNQDGIPDILYRSTQHLLDVRCGTPDGLFGEPAPCYTLPPFPAYYFDIGDVNVDGMPDVIQWTSETIRVHIAVGDGTFLDPIDTDLPRFRSPAFADMDGDGNPDVAVVSNDREEVWVLQGGGDGTYGSIESYSGFGEASRLTVGRVDDDGLADLAVWSGTSSGHIRIVLRGPGGAIHGIEHFVTQRPAVDVDFADIDEDGLQDIVVTNALPGFFTVALGVGDGTFGPHQEVGYNQVGFTELVIEDIDGDDNLDLLGTVASHENWIDDLTIVRGNGDGTFQNPARYATGYYDGASLGVVDTNGDDHSDLIVVGRDYMSIYLGADDGSLTTAPSIGLDGSPGTLALHDLNQDGSLDVVVAVYSSDEPMRVQVLRGRGDGTFETPRSIDVPVSPDHVLVGDVNGDHRPDLIVAGPTDHPASGIAVLAGQEDGTFASPVATDLDRPVTDLERGDFDGDGNLDLVVTGAVSSDDPESGVFLLRGLGEGAFEEPEAYAPNSGAASIVSGDFDGDGRLDVAATRRGEVLVLLGADDGDFGPESRFPSGYEYGAGAITAGDFDEDGVLDLAVATQVLSIMIGAGDGRFALVATYPHVSGGEWGPPDLEAVDVTADGHLDLVIVGDEFSAAVLVGQGDGTFTPGRFGYETGPIPEEAAVGDIDGDGAMDIVVSAPNYGEITLLMGTRVQPTTQPSLPIGQQRVHALPNPTRGIAVLSYHVPEPGPVRLTVYDVSGRLLRVLVDRVEVDPGIYSLSWDGRTRGSARVSAGVYFLRLETKSGISIERITRLR